MSKNNSTTPTKTSQLEISPISPVEEKIVTCKISDIILDPKINTREIDSEIVVEYKEAIEGYGAAWQDRWNELFRITESNHLWSGAHTFCAARLVFGNNGRIRCVIEGENERDAYFLATRTNAQHGRRRTNAEKETAVLRWLEDELMCEWTDGFIAGKCAVSDRFVGKCRLRTVRSQPTKRKFINAKGEIEWMHTSRIGANPTPAPAPPNEADNNDEHRQQLLDDTFNLYIRGVCKHLRSLDADLHDAREQSIHKQYPILKEWNQREQLPTSRLELMKSELETLKKDLETNGDKQFISTEAKEAPDLQGLKEEIYDLLDNGDQIYAPKLAHTYTVPLSEVELIIRQATADHEMEQAEKRKEALMNEYNDLSSTGWATWDKHLKRFISWDGLFASAQSNWIALKDSHDYSPADDSEESLKLQIAIWKNFNTDLAYVVDGDSDRGNIWLNNLLTIDVEPTTTEGTKVDDKSPRTLSMEEVESSYADIESELTDLPEDAQVQVRQFLKVHYNAYPTYSWRDKLKLDALETLAETLDHICRGIKEKGLEAFGLSAPPKEPTLLQIEPVAISDAEAKTAANQSGATDQMLSGYIDDVKDSIDHLLATEQVPLVIKYPAEELLQAIDKWFLTLDGKEESDAQTETPLRE